jgi:hypothetical protein
MSLPELAAWGREHPEAVKITATTVNKQLGAVQAICRWAPDKGGMVPDEIAWADPFAKQRLPTEEPWRESFTSEELNANLRWRYIHKRRAPRRRKGPPFGSRCSDC